MIDAGTSRTQPVEVIPITRYDVIALTPAQSHALEQAVWHLPGNDITVYTMTGATALHGEIVVEQRPLTITTL